MSLFQSIKNYFRSSFREIFVYHNSSLEFRAKLFALVAGADEAISPLEEALIKSCAADIYENDPNRATTLWLATKEYVTKIRNNNDLGIDELVKDVTYLLKRNKRFASKINPEMLSRFIEIQTDEDIKDYQRHIIDYLTTLKNEMTATT